MSETYINDATAHLVNEIAVLVSSRDELSSSSAVQESLSRFRHTCSVTPSIIGYISTAIDAAGNRGEAFTSEQLELLMFAMIARSSSTYGTIPGVVAHLALIGEHSDAAILNENAKNETGDRRYKSHPTLLYECFAAIGEALSIPTLTPARYHILRYILLQKERQESTWTDAESVRAHLEASGLHFPKYADEDIAIALYYADRYDPALTHLHSEVIEAESRLNERADATPSRNPYDEIWLAVRCLELAMREASSVDDYTANRLSYIGAWGQVVEHLAPKLSPGSRKRATAWSEAHNDEAAGQAVGWEGAAEEGHAEDARLQAVKMIAALKPEAFSNVLNEVTRLNSLRLAFWDRVVDGLKQRETVVAAAA